MKEDLEKKESPSRLYPRKWVGTDFIEKKEKNKSRLVIDKVGPIVELEVSVYKLSYLNCLF